MLYLHFVLYTNEDKNMMFDPPDYPYKELSQIYDPDDLLFSSNTEANRNLPYVDESYNDVATILSIENQISLHTNDSGRYFDVKNTSFLEEPTPIIVQNTELYVVQSDSSFSYEPTLLDENTVNQFLLPLQDSADTITSAENVANTGPDLLALHSCLICHEIFTMEADLLDHTISFHASNTTVDQQENLIPVAIERATENGADSAEFDTEWMVCRTCERVLSTALEVQPTEQLCCVDAGGKGAVSSRRLHTMYVCDLCNGLFADGDALDKHHLTCYIEDQNYFEDHNASNGLEPNAIQSLQIYFSCDICEKEFSSAEETRVHSLDCHQPGPPAQGRNVRRTYTNKGNNKMWNCGSCNQLFATARELYRHKRGEDRPPGSPLMAYVCEECDKVLGSMCALHTHKKMHKVTKPGYPCRVCGRRFNQSGHLAIHMRMHTGERPYPCDLCPKAFKVKVERDDHRRTHTGERPFACAACPKTFTAAARLREHARIHTDQRPYRCEICGAAFRRPYARTVHTLIHTGEKPHECDICGTAFRRSGDMWKHKRTLHGVQSVNVELDINRTCE